MSDHEHEWAVFSTALGEGWLMLQCVGCGLHGTVDDPSGVEWRDAFHAPGRPYRWVDGGRVTLHPEQPREPRYVVRAGAAVKPGDHWRRLQQRKQRG